jgi:hypothetical protein
LLAVGRLYAFDVFAFSCVITLNLCHADRTKSSGAQQQQPREQQQ